MATLRAELQAKIDEVEAKAAAEVAPFKAELAAGGAHLDEEWDTFKARIEAVVSRIRGIFGKSTT